MPALYPGSGDAVVNGQARSLFHDAYILVGRETINEVISASDKCQKERGGYAIECQGKTL